MKEYSYRRLYLLINEEWNCNFSCTTCQARMLPHYTMPDIDFEYFRDICEEFYSFFSNHTRIISLEGGEPLFRWQRAINIIKGVKESCPNAIIQVLSNCGMLQERPERLKELEDNGLSKLLCSINSHIPEVHNLSRGVFIDNCSFIKSIPSRMKIPVYANTILDCFNIDHIEEFIQEAKNLGFAGMFLSLNKGTLYTNEPIAFGRKKELLSFLFRLKDRANLDRDFIINPDENLQDFIDLILLGKVNQDRPCSAPHYMIMANQKRNLFFCCGGPYRVLLDLIPYTPGIIKDSFTEGTKEFKFRDNLVKYCNYPCRVSVGYMEPVSIEYYGK